MRRVLTFAGGLLTLALGTLAGACDEYATPIPAAAVPPDRAPTAGFGTGGSILLPPPTIGGSGQPGLGFCAGESPHFAPNRWSLADLDGSLDLVFGPGTRLSAVLPAELGYQRNLSTSFVSALLQVGRERVEAAALEAGALEVCEVADDTNAGCVQTWLRDYGLRLYRRPLADAQLEAYLVAYQSARAESDAVQAARNMLLAMILSPYFVMRIELGIGGGGGQLSQYEIASRISHFAARRAPDLPLLKSAAVGELALPEMGVLHLQRLWRTPEGRAARELTVLEWLGLEVANSRSDLAPELRADMDAQLHAFVADVFDARNGALDALLTGSRFPLNARLAKHYGVTVEVGEELETVELEPSLFAGLLSTGAFLARAPTPSLRGERIMNGLFCADLPAAPAEAHLGPLPEAPTPRERLALGVQGRPECQACHQTFDPVGLALSAFDADGRLTSWDSTGSVRPGPTDTPMHLVNPQALANSILTSPAARECIGRRYLELVLDRKVSRTTQLKIPVPRPISPEQRWVDCLAQTLAGPNPSLLGFAEVLVRSDLMRSRDVIPRRVLALDTSPNPLEHAYQEALQLNGAHPSAEDAAIVAEYARSLEQVRAQGEPTPPGEGGAGGQAAGGAGGAL